MQRAAEWDIEIDVLNAEWFSTSWQVQIVIDQWYKQFGPTRRRQALNMRLPIPESLLATAATGGSETGG